MSTAEIETISPKAWAQSIRDYAADGRLHQNVWNREAEEGKHIACILGAAAPNIHGVSDVPCAALCMPEWLASLTPNLFDGVRKSRAVDYALRYAEVIDRWCVLNERGWQRVQIGFILFCSRQSLAAITKGAERRPESEYWRKSVEVCAAVVALLEERDAEVRGPGEAALAADAAYAARAAALAADAARAAALAADAARAAALAADAADAALAADAADAAYAAYAADAARAAALAADAADAAYAARAAARAAAREEQFDELIRLIDEQVRIVAE